MQLFEEVSGQQYTWTLFYLLNNADIKDTKMVTETVEGTNVTITKSLSSGLGINIGQEEEFLGKCRHLHVFTKEIELALLSGEPETYLYEGVRQDEPCVIHNLNVVGHYVYVTDREICSPVLINVNEIYDNDYFPAFKEYVLNKKAIVENFCLQYEEDRKRFSIYHQNEEDGEPSLVFEITGTDVHISYPFVFYVLKKLADNPKKNLMNSSFENGFKVKRVRRKENN